MHRWSPLVMISLTGCFYISAGDADERLGWLDSAADTDVEDTDDTDVLASFVIEAIDPVIVSSCVDPAAFTVEALVDEELGGVTFGTLVSWDDEAYVAVGEATAADAFAGTARLDFSLATPLPDPLSTCSGPWCDHDLTIGLSGPADLAADVEGGVRVAAGDPPTLVASALVGADAVAVPLGDATPAETPVGAFRTAAWPGLQLGVDAPFAAAGGEATYSATLYGCALGVDPAVDPSGCVSVAADRVSSALDGDLVFEVSTVAFGATGCEFGAGSFALLVEGDPCDDDAWLPVGELRFAAADCDADGVDAPLDCDDEDADFVSLSLFSDGDGDGLGASGTEEASCVPVTGRVANDDDCDDDDLVVGLPPTWYADADDDGLGDPDVAASACTPPDAHVANALDCDDAAPGVGGATPFWRDLDDDGFGDPTDEVIACVAPAGYVDDDTDCVDSDPAVTDGLSYFEDVDGDGAGDPATEVYQCDAPTADWVPDSGDCDPLDPLAYPGAAEVCDLGAIEAGTDVDEDCDGVDDATACGTCDDGAIGPVIAESDIDCGGDCALGCAYDRDCLTDADCGSADCGGDGACDVWSRMWQGASTDVNAKVAVASNGDLVVGSTTAQTIDVGGGPTAPSGTQGNNDVVVARYTAAGQLVWQRRFGTGGNDALGDLAVDEAGNVAIAWDFAQAGVVDGRPIAPVAGRDVVVVHLAPNGTTTWVSALPGPGGDELAMAVVFAPNGELAVGGTAASGTVGQVVWLARSDGSVRGATRFDGSDSDAVRALAVHPSGDLLVAGYYGLSGTGTSEVEVTPGNQILTSVVAGTGRDGFAARLSSATRDARWIVALQGLGDQEVTAIAAGAGGEVFVGGRVEELASLAGGLVVGPAAAHYDAVLGRLDPATGAHVWSASWGAAGNDHVASVASIARDRLAVAYYYAASHDADPSPTGVANVLGVALGDAALSAFRYDGTFDEVAAWPDPGRIAVDGDARAQLDVTGDPVSGAVFVAGSTDAVTDLGDARRTDAADPVGFMGVYFSSLGPGSWPSTLPRDGATAARAGTSCLPLHEDYPTLVSGPYWIDPNGGATADAFRVYCDMSTVADGVAGGWTRVASLQSATTSICDLATARGTAEDVATGIANQNTWLAPAQGDSIPFARREVLLYSSNALYQAFQSDHADFTWSNIADGTVNSSSIDPLQIGLSMNGAAYIDPWGEGQYYLLGALHPGGRSMSLGVGAPGCSGLGVGAMYSGDPTRAWGTTGYVYVR